MDGFPDNVRLSAADWPPGCREPRPGDLQFFVPQGFGLGAPAVVMPYGGLPENSYYGFHEPQVHPFLNAPLTESRGGTLYFDDGTKIDALNEALSVMGVHHTVDYAAFSASSADPLTDRYLDQMRLVSQAALSAVFGAAVAEPIAKQTLNVAEAVGAFVSSQKAKWNDDYAFSAKLAGAAGGDGDWAKESLAFGFQVENTYWGVYRVWSRAWLVTK